MDTQSLLYLAEMGIQVYTSRWQPDNEVTASEVPENIHSNIASEAKDNRSSVLASAVNQMDWPNLRNSVSECKLCALAKSRTQTVFGTGSETADWLFIGEAPGQEEDRKGEPFVGRAGQLLDNMLLALGLCREQVFIANILKCRPPNNRDPKTEESNACRPHLQRQIELLQPRIIIALGRIAAQALLDTDTPIGRLRGKEYSYSDTNIPLVVTYHPAYLLRSPEEKHKSWQDLLLAKQCLKDV